MLQLNSINYIVQECNSVTRRYMIDQLLVEVEKEQSKTLPKFAEIKKFFLGSGILGVQRAMNEKLNRWKEVKINLAILGNSGVGKSSFINAIRG